jgi:hypothetical protein
MSHSWAKLQSWNAENKAYDNTTETSSEVRIKKGDAVFAVKAANDHWAVAVEGDLLDEDWKVEGCASYESKPAENNYTAAIDADIKSPDMGGVKAFINVSVLSDY